MKLQAVQDFYWALRLVYEEYLNCNVKLTPTCLIYLKWEFFYRLNRIWEGGVKLKNYFFDKIRDVFVIIETANIT